MAVTLALFTFVQVAMPLWVRPHLVPPVAESVTFSASHLDGIRLTEGGELRLTLSTGTPGDWILTNHTVDSSGTPTALPSWMGDCLPGPPPGAAAGRAQVAERPDLGGCFARLNDEGYRQRIVYQPASHFWRLQWTETALFLVVSGLLAGFCFWWTRRRLN